MRKKPVRPTVENVEMLSDEYEMGVDARFQAFCLEYMAQFGAGDYHIVNIPYGMALCSFEWQFTILTVGRQDGKMSTAVLLTEVDGRTQVLLNELVSMRDGHSAWCRAIETAIEGHIMTHWSASRKPFDYVDARDVALDRVLRSPGDPY